MQRTKALRCMLLALSVALLLVGCAAQQTLTPLSREEIQKVTPLLALLGRAQLQLNASLQDPPSAQSANLVLYDRINAKLYAPNEHIRRQDAAAQVDAVQMQSLYRDCFAQGDYPGLGADAQQDRIEYDAAAGVYTFALTDTVEYIDIALKQPQALESGDLRIDVDLSKTLSDGASQVRSASAVVRRSPSSYFGFQVVSFELL